MTNKCVSNKEKEKLSYKSMVKHICKVLRKVLSIFMLFSNGFVKKKRFYHF